MIGGRYILSLGTVKYWPPIALWPRVVCIFLALGLLGVGCSTKNGVKPAERGSLEVRLVPQLGHDSNVLSVAFSQDGRYVLSGGGGMIKIWDAQTGAEIRSFHAKAVTSVAFSPDGHNVLSGSEGTAKLTDIQTGMTIRTFTGQSFGVDSVAYSSDGRYVLTGGGVNTAKLWDAHTGTLIRTLIGHTDWICSVAFSADGRYALTGSRDFTAKLWDARTAREIHTFSGHSDGVSSVAFSPDGRYVLTGSHDKTAKLWDAKTGVEVCSFVGHSGYVFSVAFSPDGRFVLTGSRDKTARLWDAQTGAEIRTFSGHSDLVWSVVFSRDGRFVLTGSWDQSAKLWDAKTGALIRSFIGYARWIDSVAFSPDDRFIITGGWDNTARLWDAQTGAAIHVFSGHSHPVTSVAFSPDGCYALTGSIDMTARLWDAKTGAELRAFSGGDSLTAVAFSPDGRFILAGSTDHTAKLWDAKTGAELRTFSGHSGWVVSAIFSHDGRYVLTASQDDTVLLWNALTGAKVQRFVVHSWANSIDFSSDGRYILVGYNDSTARLWDVQSGKEIRRFNGHSGPIESVMFSGDGRFILTGSVDDTAKLWNTQTGAEIRTFSGHSSSVNSVLFSGDGRLILTGSDDGTTRLWDKETGRELCSLISFDDGTWAVVDSEGRFDASNGGNVEGLHWVAGLEPIALSQLKERYYDPGLLAKHLGYNKDPLREVQAFKYVKLFPDVRVQAPTPGSTQLKISLANRGGGVGKVRVLVNGKEIITDARGPMPNPEAKSAKLTVDLAEAAAIPGQKNKVEVIAWNAEGYLSSRGDPIDWTPPQNAISAAQAPELYAIIGGISEYSSETLKLHYAAKDAQDMATALEVGAKRLLGADKVHLTLLASSSDPRAIPPTRANFLHAFKKARRAKPWDILVVYLSGHGVAFGGEADIFAYLTREARSTELTDPAVRQAVAITSEELTEWIKRIPALKQVMILDTCSAGAAAGKLMEARAPSSSQIRAIERLKDRTGFHVLMGCAADKVSYEASEYGQGLLTYALLQGMRGGALREDEYVDVSRLFQYAEDQVPQLARFIGGIQRPKIAAPEGSSFDVGRLTGEDKPKIPLAMIRPLVLRPILINPQENDDNLNLSVELRKALAANSYIISRGGANAPQAVFVDADELPGAVRPSGTYLVEGKRVAVRLTLKRDGQKIAIVEVRGTKDDLSVLAEKIARVITQALGPGV